MSVLRGWLSLAVRILILLAPAAAYAAVVIVTGNSPGWGVGEVGSSTVAITETNPRSGNGSLEWAAGTSGYAIVSYNSFGGGAWGSLDTLSADWYLDTANTLSPIPDIALHVVYPSHSFYVFAGWHIGVKGSWQTTDYLALLELQTNLGTPPGSLAEIPADANVNQIQLRGVHTLGMPWHGFMDNLTIGFAGTEPTTYNFETPEPSSLHLLAPCLLLPVLARRKRSARTVG